MADMKLGIVMRLVDRVSGPLRSVRRAIGSVSEQLEKAKKASKADFETAADIKQAAEGVGQVAASARSLVSSPVAVAADFEKQISRLAAISGATGETLARLRSTALELGAATAFSSSQAAEAMQALGQGGFKAEQQIAALPGVLDLAAAAGSQLGETAGIMINMIGGFKMEAGEAGHVADVLAATTTSSAVSLLELADTMAYAAPTASALGVSLERTAAIAGALADVGIKGSRAGTGLNAMLSALVAPKGAGAKALAALKIEPVDKATGKMRDLMEVFEEIRQKTSVWGEGKQSRFFDAVFGRDAAPAVTALMKQLDKVASLQATLEASSEGDGVAKQMAATMLDNYAGAAEEFDGAIESLQITLGSALLPTLTAIARGLTVVIGAVANFAAEHPILSKVVMFSVAALAGLLTALTGVLAAMATFASASGVLTFVKSMGLTTAALKGSTAAAVSFKAAAAGIGATAGAIGAAAVGVGAAGFAAYREWDNLKELFTDFTGYGGLPATYREMVTSWETYNPFSWLSTAGKWWGKELGLTGDDKPTVKSKQAKAATAPAAATQAAATPAVAAATAPAAATKAAMPPAAATAPATAATRAAAPAVVAPAPATVVAAAKPAPTLGQPVPTLGRSESTQASSGPDSRRMLGRIEIALTDERPRIKKLQAAPNIELSVSAGLAMAGAL